MAKRLERGLLQRAELVQGWGSYSRKYGNSFTVLWILWTHVPAVVCLDKNHLHVHTEVSIRKMHGPHVKQKHSDNGKGTKSLNILALVHRKWTLLNEGYGSTIETFGNLSSRMIIRRDVGVSRSISTVLWRDLFALCCYIQAMARALMLICTPLFRHPNKIMLFNAFLH